MDHPIATPALVEHARSEAIYQGEKFSDHAPLTIEYDFAL
jgi:exodeoxyribonuclease III